MSRLKRMHLVNYQVSGAVIYEIAFVYYFVIAFLQSSTYADYVTQKAFHYLSLLSLGLVLFKMFFLDKREVKIFIFNMACLGLLVITWRTSQDFALLPMGIFILGARGVDFRQICKLYFIIGTILLLFIMLSSLTGLIKNLVYFRDQSNTMRQSFGIAYPTDFAAHVLFLVLSYIYIKFEKLKWTDYLVFAIIAYSLIVFCDARLSAIALLISIPVTLIGKRATQGKLISSFIASFYWTIPIILAYFSCVSAIFFNSDNHIFEKTNRLLSGRLMLSHLAYKKYGFSLFGEHVVEHGWGGTKGLAMLKNNPSSYFFIDSSYVRIMLFFGIIALLLVIFIMTLIAWRSIHSETFKLATVMVIVAISAMVEQRLIDLSYDPFLLALFASTIDIKLKERIP